MEQPDLQQLESELVAKRNEINDKMKKWMILSIQIDKVLARIKERKEK